MSEIQRYSPEIFCNSVTVEKNDKGQFVTYDDHLKVVEQLQDRHAQEIVCEKVLTDRAHHTIEEQRARIEELEKLVSLKIAVDGTIEKGINQLKVEGIREMLIGFLTSGQPLYPTAIDEYADKLERSDFDKQLRESE